MARKTRVSTLMISGIAVEVSHKSMKYVRLKVCSPSGDVKVSAPHHTSVAVIEQFVREKQAWIRSQQLVIQARPVQVPLRFQSGEVHHLFGRPYTILLIDKKIRGGVAVDDETQTLQMMSSLDERNRELALDNWYKKRLAEHIPEMIHRWQPVIEKPVAEWRIRKMRTRWGTCNIEKRRIWLSLELAKKPLECLEYVVVHEMTHLHERYHNQNFYRLMDCFLPDWRSKRRLLNSDSQEPATENG